MVHSLAPCFILHLDTWVHLKELVACLPFSWCTSYIDLDQLSSVRIVVDVKLKNWWC